MGKALDTSRLLEDGKYIVSVITKETMGAYGATSKDLDAIVSQLKVTKGVEVAIFLYQTSENEFKISLRSKNDWDVSKVAVTFGGGGHVKAAGVTMKGTAEEILEKLVKELNLQA